MDNIMYLDDFINIYNKKIDKLISIKPYKKTLKYGKVIDKERFIKSFKLIKKKYRLNNYIFSENLLIIVNSTFSKEDKALLKMIMEELNYKDIKYINELEIINIDKKSLYIIYNYGYYYFYFLDEEGKAIIKKYENDYINKKLIANIIDIINKEKIYIIGKNYKELIDKMNEKDNYFYYEYGDNLFINLLKNKSV